MELPLGEERWLWIEAGSEICGPASGQCKNFPQSFLQVIFLHFLYKMLNCLCFSEPKSILAPEKELTREELEALIAEHGQESRPESRVSGAGGSRPGSRAARTQVNNPQHFCFLNISVPFDKLSKNNLQLAN